MIHLHGTQWRRMTLVLLAMLAGSPAVANTCDPPSDGVAIDGLRLLTTDGQTARDQEETPERLVVLVHGLDDPGWTWRDVISALDDAGHEVARFDYPSENSISDAANGLADALEQLRSTGTSHVDLVAHSMGGLVARDVLTRDDYYGSDGSGGEKYPAVDRLIMIGTPNAGAPVVRFRGILDLVDRIERALDGDKKTIRIEANGDIGDAGRDLLPKSRFLTDLNQRPHPTHTQFTIVAGRIKDLADSACTRFLNSAQETMKDSGAPRWLRNWASDNGPKRLAALINDVSESIGDGLVSLTSARLPGVADFVEVEANHASLIVNMNRGKESVPAAIPIILDRLEDEPPPGP